MSDQLIPNKSKTDTLAASLDTLRAIGVARQSRTSDDSYSVNDQIAAVRGSCETQGIDLLHVEQEPDTSGQRPLKRRHGLLRAVEAIERGEAEVLIVAYFDRLARKFAVQQEVLDRVEAAGGRVLTLDHGQITSRTPAEWLSGSVIGLVNEYLARSVGERTHTRKVENVKNGIPHFPRITIAYERITEGDNKGKLKPSKYAPLVREAASMRLRGESWETITRWLHEQDVIDPRTGKLVTRSAVLSMFKSPLLVGDVHWGGITTRDAHEAIIDRETQRAILAKSVSRGRYTKSERLLSRLGVLRCETCGSRMSVATTKSGGKSYPYYRCGARPACTAPASVAADVAENFVRDETIRLAAGLQGTAHVEADIEAARVEREEAEAGVAKAFRFAMKHESEDAAQAMIDEAVTERDLAVVKHERLARLSRPATITTAADWDLATFDEKRDLIVSLIEIVTVTPGRGPGRLGVVEL